MTSDGSDAVGVDRATRATGPRFVSVTYGADGSTRERTHEAVERIVNETDLTAAPHLTCVGASRGEIDDIARAYWDMGVRHLVALAWRSAAGSRSIAASGRLRLCVRPGCRSEQGCRFRYLGCRVPRSASRSAEPAVDLDNLKRKLDAGATRAITQFFFDTDVFLRFRDLAAAAGIDSPIVPGILPITRFPQLERFADAVVPACRHGCASAFADSKKTQKRAR